LKGNHGADFSAVKNIKEQGFNDIVFVMTEGDFVTFETMGEMEQAFSSFPGTEETGVFSILRTVRPYPDIRELNVIRESFHFKKILQDCYPPRINPSTLQPEGWSLPSTRDFGELSRAAQAEGLRVDPERGFFTPPSKAGLGAAEWANLEEVDEGL